MGKRAMNLFLFGTFSTAEGTWKERFILVLSILMHCELVIKLQYHHRQLTEDTYLIYINNTKDKMTICSSVSKEEIINEIFM
jgi:hypothetical protein